MAGGAASVALRQPSAPVAGHEAHYGSAGADDDEFFAADYPSSEAARQAAADASNSAIAPACTMPDGYELVAIRLMHRGQANRPQNDDVWYDYRPMSDAPREGTEGITVRIRQYVFLIDQADGPPDAVKVETGRDDVHLYRFTGTEKLPIPVQLVLVPEVPPGTLGLIYYLDAFGEDRPSDDDLVEMLLSTYPE